MMAPSVLRVLILAVAGAQTAVPTAGAQGSVPLPKSFPELVGVLPTLVHTKQLQFGPYSDAVDLALANDPSSAARAIPLLSRNMQDPDADVQFYTLCLLQALAARADYLQLVAPLSGQIARAISSGAERTRVAALVDADRMFQKAPDVVVVATEQLLESRPSSPRLLLGSAETLMYTRPKDEHAQEEVLAAMRDARVPTETRQAILGATDFTLAGSKVQDEVVQIANTSTDKNWRNAAIHAAIRIGPEALVQIRSLLNQIQQDPAGSPEARELAVKGLGMLATQ